MFIDILIHMGNIIIKGIKVIEHIFTILPNPLKKKFILRAFSF